MKGTPCCSSNSTAVSNAIKHRESKDRPPDSTDSRCAAADRSLGSRRSARKTPRRTRRSRTCRSRTIVARTPPGVREFFDRCVVGAERPPVKESYAKLGITLVEDQRGTRGGHWISAPATKQLGTASRATDPSASRPAPERTGSLLNQLVAAVVHAPVTSGVSRVRKHVRSEAREPRLSGEAKQRKVKDLLDALEHRVVIVPCLRDRPRFDEPREQHRADRAAARAIAAGKRSIGAGHLVAAGGRPARAFGLIGRDEQHSILLERGRVEDERDPFPQKQVCGHQAARLAGHARRVMAVVTYIGCDEHVAWRPVFRRQVGLEEREGNDARLA